MKSLRWCFSTCWIVVVLLLAASSASADDRITLRFDINDIAGDPLACRIHLYDAAGKPQRAFGLPFWRDHFVCSGESDLRLPAGEYRYEIERGHEYERVAGTVVLEESKDRTVRASLPRIADLKKRGWYSGDLHVHRHVADVPLLMEAEDLSVAPVITWWNNRNLWTDRTIPQTRLKRLVGDRFLDMMAGEDEREGGALLYFHLDKPIDITQSTREYPSPMEYVAAARGQNPDVWIDIEKPFWWDVPIWTARGKVDSIGIANNHMCRSQMYETEAWGRPRDAKQLPAPHGNGYWTQEIYYHLLNCGIRLPPSAGSASGVLPNPVGYNRVYVHVDGKFEYAKWWEGLKAGRSFVTNGPLLICKANGQLPGHVFRSKDGDAIKIELELELTTLDPIRKIEVIKNGRVDSVAETDDARTQTQTATVTFRKSGWFLVRAITDNPRTFRFASTAPYYVEIGDNPKRISRKSVQFFLDWIDERSRRVGLKLKDAQQLQEVLKHHSEARQIWLNIRKKANTE